MSDSSPLQRSLTVLSGVGSQTAGRFQRLGLFSLGDLLFHLPFRYQDRTRFVPIRQLMAGLSALILARVDFVDSLQRGRQSVVCRISDETGELNLRFFHFSAQQLQQFKPGVRIACYGEIRYGIAGLEMIHPEYKIGAAAETWREEQLTPVYPCTEGLSQNLLRKAIDRAMRLCLPHIGCMADGLPEAIRQAMGYPCLADALQTVHNPPAELSLQQVNAGDLPALKRLAFEEFLAHHLIQLQTKRDYKAHRAPRFCLDEQAQHAFIERLPFQLTNAQRRVLNEIVDDCVCEKPMLRLVQGDVGSGKTVVAALAALLALGSGFQVTVMAPTELLAEQHFRNFSQWFADSGVQVHFLSGQIKGKTRQQILHALANDAASLVIGTHALFQEHVHFLRLGLIIIDEQHRFGVHQRLALREKGSHSGLRPHQLVMTATPIPRTLAMLHYSDLDVSIIDELPPGRKSVVTSVIPGERRQEVIARLRQWVAQGHQAYWVCTLIEESDQLQCEAAEKTAETLRQALPEVRVGLVHGRMKSVDKEAVMQGFKQHASDLLVATTVIEVGVDVPNAALMVIENAERLGLSQLHQLRGRVGRGSLDSYCLLLYQSPLSALGKQRLAILRETGDGFVIAEKDLELRGPGEVLGTRQTGQMQFKIADLSRDRALLSQVPPVAEQIVQHDPDAIATLIERWVGHKHHYAEV